MQSNPKYRRTNPILYFFFGLFLGLLLVFLVSILSLVTNNLPFTLNNLILLHLNNLLFLLLDVYAFIFAILFGFIGLERNRSNYARAQLQWLNQKRSAELHRLTDDMQSQDQKYKELEAVISRGKQQCENNAKTAN